MYRILELPGIYNLVQAFARIGGTRHTKELFADFVDSGGGGSVLELGCGTGIWSVTDYQRFVRTDVNAKYFPTNPPSGIEYRVVDAADLSGFADDSFDLVYSMGLYHHLPDDAFLQSLSESARVVRAGGRIVLFDAILPTRFYRVPAWILRKLDRGGWVRSEVRTMQLLKDAGLTILRSKRCRWGPGLEGHFFELAPATTDETRKPPLTDASVNGP